MIFTVHSIKTNIVTAKKILSGTICVDGIAKCIHITYGWEQISGYASDLFTRISKHTKAKQLKTIWQGDKISINESIIIDKTFWQKDK